MQTFNWDSLVDIFLNTNIDYNFYIILGAFAILITCCGIIVYKQLKPTPQPTINRFVSKPFSISKQSSFQNPSLSRTNTISMMSTPSTTEIPYDCRPVVKSRFWEPEDENTNFEGVTRETFDQNMNEQIRTSGVVDKYDSVLMKSQPISRSSTQQSILTPSKSYSSGIHPPTFKKIN
ncbi:hypothetical protein QTN25_004345 [Entamoeba marina]